LDNTKPENKRGNLNAKKKLDITKKKINTIDGRPPKSKGVLCSKSDIGTLFGATSLFSSERWETMPLCFIVEYDLFIDFHKDKHLKINYLKFDRKTK
jgi:hypothetical protein